LATLREVICECEKCGSEIVVKETGKTELAPIYCCCSISRTNRGLTMSSFRSLQDIRQRRGKS
jgi:hypothetical protein